MTDHTLRAASEAQVETRSFRVDSVLAQQSVPVAQGTSDDEEGGAGEELVGAGVGSGEAVVPVGAVGAGVGSGSPMLRFDPHPTTSQAASAKSDV
ncbi:MAG: hypothetical protein IPF92_24940 [Myxococcales bacterium]|nr:hypothetical protein [Myxococcales bacterium]